MRHGLWAAVLAASALVLVGAEPSRPGEPRSFQGRVSAIAPSLRSRLTSWHRGCPVPVSELRLLQLTYVGFDGESHDGEMILDKAWARPVLGVFRKLYEARFPIRRMRLPEAYGSNDDRLGFADDTSGFNCRYDLAARQALGDPASEAPGPGAVVDDRLLAPELKQRDEAVGGRVALALGIVENFRTSGVELFGVVLTHQA